MSKSKLMLHKGFYGSADVSLEDDILFGKIECINDLVTYEAETPLALKAAFEEAVDDYLATCEAIGKEPEKPFSGTFNVRVGAEIHKKAYIKSLQEGISLNDLVKKAIETHVDGRQEVHMHIHAEKTGTLGKFSIVKTADASKQMQWTQHLRAVN